MAPVDEWRAFCASWGQVLNRFKARYFHFREWATASAVARKVRAPESNFANNPYCGWSSQALDDFLLELARIAGAGNKLIVGGAVYTNVFHELQLKGSVPSSGNPYEYCLDQYFISVEGTVAIQRAPWKRQPVSFFFDRTDNKEWRDTVTHRFNYFKKVHSTFKEVEFADKMNQLPLQAADMVAYRTRQITEKWVDGDSRVWAELDDALFKSTFNFLENHKSEVLIAYLRGQLNYEFYKRQQHGV